MTHWTIDPASCLLTFQVQYLGAARTQSSIEYIPGMFPYDSEPFFPVFSMDATADIVDSDEYPEMTFESPNVVQSDRIEEHL